MPIWSVVALVAGPVTILLPPSTAPAQITPSDELIVVFSMIPWATGALFGQGPHTLRRLHTCVTHVLRSGPRAVSGSDNTRPATADYIIVVQLVDANFGSTRLRLNYQLLAWSWQLTNINVALEPRYS